MYVFACLLACGRYTGGFFSLAGLVCLGLGDWLHDMDMRIVAVGWLHKVIFLKTCMEVNCISCGYVSMEDGYKGSNGKSDRSHDDR